jgi:hypothetical protein
MPTEGPLHSSMAVEDPIGPSQCAEWNVEETEKGYYDPHPISSVLSTKPETLTDPASAYLFQACFPVPGASRPLFITIGYYSKES